MGAIKILSLCIYCARAFRIPGHGYYGTYHYNLKKCPKDGGNKPDISILDKKNKEWSLVEGTICTPGTIAERTKYKHNKYVGLMLGIKNFYPGYKVKLITIVFDYLGAYYKDLDEELNMLFGPNLARLTIERSQKWVISQKCEIVKRFSCM